MGIFISTLTIFSFGFFAHYLYKREVQAQDMERKISSTQEKFTNK